MIRFKESFHRLNVRDLMGEIAVTVPQQMTLRDAAGLLSRAKVGSAPVTDSNGRCVGILSASAFVSWVASSHDFRTSTDAFRDCVWSEWQILGEEGKLGLDGCVVARRLRQQNIESRPLLVAVTGYGDAKSRRLCRAAGFDYHLLKPVEPDVLHRLLASCFPAAGGIR